MLSKWLLTDRTSDPGRTHPGIDVGANFEIYTIVNRLVAAGKRYRHFVGLPELLGMCDRIYTLAAGRITGEVPAGEATQENLMELMTQDRELVG